MAGAYSRHVAHPTFKTLFLSSEESEEFAIGFFEKNKATNGEGPFESLEAGTGEKPAS